MENNPKQTQQKIKDDLKKQKEELKANAQKIEFAFKMKERNIQNNNLG